MERDTLALEILKEVKAQSKRWFIIAIIELVIIIASNVGWLIYNSQFETVANTETTTEYSQEADTDGNNSPINQSMGE